MCTCMMPSVEAVVVFAASSGGVWHQSMRLQVVYTAQERVVSVELAFTLMHLDACSCVQVRVWLLTRLAICYARKNCCGWSIASRRWSCLSCL